MTTMYNREQDRSDTYRKAAVCVIATLAIPLTVWAIAPAAGLWAPLAIITPFFTMSVLEHLLARPHRAKPQARPSAAGSRPCLRPWRMLLRSV